MKFCLVTSFYPPFHPGGCGLHVYHLANLLAAAGHRVEVICSPRAHTAKINAPRPGDYPHRPGVAVRRLETPGGRAEVLLTYLLGQSVFSRGPLRRALADDFDVIHYHNISLLGGPAALELGAGVKLFTLHTYWLLCPTHYLWKNKKEVCSEKACLRCLLAYRRPPQLWRFSGLLRRSLAGVDSLIMPCRYMIARHRDEGFEHRMDHLPYFVEEVKDSGLARSEAEFGNLRPFFLLVSRLESYKVPDLAVEIFLRRPGKAGLVVVGTGSRAGALKKKAAGCGRIRFLDYVAPDRLAWLYRNAVALLAPSVWPEMGNQTVLQAASCGTPSIVSDRGCLPELIEDGRSGIVFGERAGLAAALDRMEEGRFRSSLSARAVGFYRENFTPEIFLKNYLELISELKGGKG